MNRSPRMTLGCCLSLVIVACSTSLVAPRHMGLTALGQETADSTSRSSGRLSRPDVVASRAAVESLRAQLDSGTYADGQLAESDFASVPLTREDAKRVERLLWEARVKRLRRTREPEMKSRELTDGQWKLPFYYKVFGDAPAGGRSLYISLHGGGGTAARVNDQQWENQKRLYAPPEGVYVAPRAPTNTWNLWHQAHIDRLFARLIENLVVFENVNPDRVYILGYSAGGDGVYQLAPRMADRWAAAAMMAGHPNDASPLGLRNIGFTLHVGGKDSAYNRNKVAAQWKARLAELRRSDPNGYVHLAKIYPDKAHWLDREDAVAIDWMAEHRRDPHPRRIVWQQDDVTHRRFYWLQVAAGQARAGAKVVAQREGQRIAIDTGDVQQITIRLNDRMLDLDQPITVSCNGQPGFEGRLARTIQTVAETLEERGDPRALYSAEVTVQLAP